MFSQKKRNHTWIYVTLIVLLLVVGVFILIGALNSSGEEDSAPTNSTEQVEESQNANNSKSNEENSESENVYQSYYLVKYDNNVIKIYFSDEKGKLTVLEDTTIIYDTLSPDDQKRFQDGIKLNTRDDLNRLIMDYES